MSRKTMQLLGWGIVGVFLFLGFNSLFSGACLSGKNLPEEAIKYTGSICRASQKYHVDPLYIVSIITRESDWKANVRSECGAAGLMQVMPGNIVGPTADQVRGCGGFTCGENGEASCFSDRPSQWLLFSPSINIDTGTKILAQYMKACGGEMYCALSMYGPAGYSGYAEEITNIYRSYVNP
jgi:soluble lytic murein transglycosylase-like protein